MKLHPQKLSVIGLLIMLAGLIPASGAAQSAPTQQRSVGILLLAHGGKKKWNKDVRAVAMQVNETVPTQVAFGMANRGNMQSAVDRLIQQGVHEIVAVPLFVSSHSSLIEATQYLLGLRAKAPPALAMYTRMHHDLTAHAGMEPRNSAVDPATPIKSRVPIHMTSAIDHSPLVAQILLSHAERLSQNPAQETVVLVAHGPVSDANNQEWLADMSILADSMRRNSQFKSVKYLTLRDDASKPVRSRATAQLRAVVEQAGRQGDRVLIVPLLISYGGIEKGIKKRLAGLKYVMSRQGLLPDSRMAEWVLQQAQATPQPAANLHASLRSSPISTSER